MNSILIDTNIVIDLLAKREEFYHEAAELFSLADKKELKLSISSLTFANTNYVLSKQKSAKEAREILRKFKVLVNILNLDHKIIELALSNEEFTDFENGLQYYSALENNLDLILTRNKKDFKNSKLPVLTAEEYLAGEENANG
jgi:predicted nucleic acid-binding protein